MLEIFDGYGFILPGPIKRESRCIEKAETDYATEKFPRSNKLIDIIRCSVTFQSPGELLKCIDMFKEVVSDGQTSFVKIARIKNGFVFVFSF